MVREKIEAARGATDGIMVEVDKVRARLAGPWWANGFGVFKESGDIRSDIRASIADLTKALEILDAAKWPTNRDYDQADAEGLC